MNKKTTINYNTFCYNALMLISSLCFFAIGKDNYIVAGSVIIMIVLYFFKSYKFRISKMQLLIISAYIIIAAFMIRNSQYDKNYSLLYFLSMFVTAILFEKVDYFQRSCISMNLGRIDWIYYLMLFSFIYNIISQRNSESVLLVGASSISFTSIVAFLIFLYANKKRYLSGIIFGFAYGVFIGLDSRLYLLAMLAFYLFRFFKGSIYKFLIRIKCNKLMVLWLLSVVGVVVISIFWTFSVSSNGTSLYHQSLNDRSNRIRTVSNVKAAMLLIDPKENLTFYGYGQNIYEALGIDRDDPYASSYYLGVRLVQPHSTSMNMFLRLGIIPTVLYMLLLSGVVDTLFDEDNLPYIVSFLLMSMIVHSLYMFPYCTLWLLILAVKESDSKFLRKRNGNRTRI